jgi:hypothetical protein
MSERMFPIQAQCTYTGKMVSIPWAWAEEGYKEYAAEFGTSQSLERMAERHGFGAYEFIELLIKRIRKLQPPTPPAI